MKSSHTSSLSLMSSHQDLFSYVYISLLTYLMVTAGLEWTVEQPSLID